MQITSALRRAAQVSPTGTATIFKDRSHNWLELLERVQKLAGALQKLGMKPGDRIIFYLAYFELLYTDTPGPVVINEAVELAKEFGGDRSSRFINGALSTAFHELKDTLPEKEKRKEDIDIITKMTSSFI